MSRRLKLATHGLGAEPHIPEIGRLSAWIAEHRGTPADLTTYRLFESLSPQIEAKIDFPCAGGVFLKEKIQQCLSGVTERKVIDELSVNTSPLSEDACFAATMKRNIWFALPAPHFLNLSDSYYNDGAEWEDALARVYRTIMREMRDAGAAGHILISEKAHESEIAALARREVLFYPQDPGIDGFKDVLEHQSSVVVNRSNIMQAFAHFEEFDISQMIIIEPETETLKAAFSYLDADQIRAGGYCTEECAEYWKKIVRMSEYTR